MDFHTDIDILQKIVCAGKTMESLIETEKFYDLINIFYRIIMRCLFESVSKVYSFVNKRCKNEQKSRLPLSAIYPFVRDSRRFLSN